ncbi:hypothetical protein CDAR_245441 [Caerostris darwini]|uniref:Uncharacterized protein n=1 Tax=Caerostris darwini TaxID=1538125 RepID=A0AAV4P0R0_9ARAC|nr:hypothetical protein CDAR_245121 [Caerostris darwini]GIX89796.1 hypothetical protein CDAR_245441 [Caerostris darwini]
MNELLIQCQNLLKILNTQPQVSEDQYSGNTSTARKTNISEVKARLFSEAHPNVSRQKRSSPILQVPGRYIAEEPRMFYYPVRCNVLESSYEKETDRHVLFWQEMNVYLMRHEL